MILANQMDFAFFGVSLYQVHHFEWQAMASDWWLHIFSTRLTKITNVDRLAAKITIPASTFYYTFWLALFFLQWYLCVYKSYILLCRCKVICHELENLFNYSRYIRLKSQSIRCTKASLEKKSNEKQKRSKIISI